MRGYLFINIDKKDKYFDLCFDAYWKNNEDISKAEIIKKILSKCEVDPNDFEKGIKDQKIKDELKNLTNIAFQNDIFGAPTFVVNNNLFCAGGMRSALAAKSLKDMGFKKVSHIDGGFGALKQSKFKIT